MASSSLVRIRAIVVLFPLPQKVHGVFFREHESVVVVAGDSKRSFWVAMDCDEGFSFSVRLAMCPVERERDPPGCRASGLSPERHRRACSAVVGSAAASSSGAGTDGATSTASRLLFLDCPRKFRLRPLWWLQKSCGFYSCRPQHCPVDASSLGFFAAPEAYKRGRLSDGYITMKLNNTPLLIAADTTDNSASINTVYRLLYFLIITEYLNNRNKNAHSHANWALRASSASSFNRS